MQAAGRPQRKSTGTPGVPWREQKEGSTIGFETEGASSQKRKKQVAVFDGQDAGHGGKQPRAAFASPATAQQAVAGDTNPSQQQGVASGAAGPSQPQAVAGAPDTAQEPADPDMPTGIAVLAQLAELISSTAVQQAPPQPNAPLQDVGQPAAAGQVGQKRKRKGGAPVLHPNINGVCRIPQELADSLFTGQGVVYKKNKDRHESMRPVKRKIKEFPLTMALRSLYGDALGLRLRDNCFMEQEYAGLYVAMHALRHIPEGEQLFKRFVWHEETASKAPPVVWKQAVELEQRWKLVFGEGLPAEPPGPALSVEDLLHMGELLWPAAEGDPEALHPNLTALCRAPQELAKGTQAAKVLVSKDNPDESMRPLQEHGTAWPPPSGSAVVLGSQFVLTWFLNVMFGEALKLRFPCMQASGAAVDLFVALRPLMLGSKVEDSVRRHVWHCGGIPFDAFPQKLRFTFASKRAARWRIVFAENLSSEEVADAAEPGPRLSCEELTELGELLVMK